MIFIYYVFARTKCEQAHTSLLASRNKNHQKNFAFMKHYFSNHEIANILFEMAALYEMDGVPFKPRAYRSAAQTIESMSGHIADLFKRGGEKALDGLPGIGVGIARHIKELFTRGHFKEYEAMKKKIPVDILALTALEGVGPRTVKILWQKLKIKTVDDLERAVKAGKLLRLPHFGARSQKKILKSIGFQRESGKRFPLRRILPEAERLKNIIADFPEIRRVEVAGSIRRRKETVGDIDILAVSKHPEKVMKRFVKLPVVAYVYGSGPTKTNVRLSSGIDADLRVVPASSWGAALNYFTGSKAHNVALRAIAVKRGWKLNEYGLFKGKKQIAGKTEKDLYEALGLSYVEPEMREGVGEIAAAVKNGRRAHAVLRMNVK